jgi:glyoxylase I family protein
MLVADLHHVSINVADVDRALAFYVGVLGLRPLDRPNFGFAGAWLDTGSGRQVHLIHAEPPVDLGQHFAFRVDDIDDTCAQLAAAGIDVTGPKPVASGRQAFFFDPDGNRLEVNQPG